MARAPSTFRQQDVTRAIRAAIAAGVDIARIEVAKDGRIIIVTGVAEPAVQDDLEPPGGVSARAARSQQ